MKTEIEKYHPCVEAVEFRKEFKTFEEAWKKCPRGDWMLWIAQRSGVDLRPLTLAKALCAKTVIHLMTDDRSKKAVRVAERFGRGKATRDELDAASSAAASASTVDDADAASYASYASSAAADASSYADAADDADAASDVASYADSAASSAVSASSADADAARQKNQLATAKICRRVLTKEVFKKLLNKILEK
jgi:hypothetical protein